MNVQHLVYEDGVIAVALVAPSATTSPLLNLNVAIRWLQPHPYTGKDGQRVKVTNHMGGETDWFVIPSTLAGAVGRTLVGQKAAGVEGFQNDGFAALVRWLVDIEYLPDAMCY